MIYPFMTSYRLHDITYLYTFISFCTRLCVSLFMCRRRR